MFNYNPLVLKVLDTLMNNKDAIILRKDESAFVCCYPLDATLDKSSANSNLLKYEIVIKEIGVDSFDDETKESLCY